MASELIGAVGAGRMGRGISLAFAFGGFDVALIDLKSRDRTSHDIISKEALGEIRNDLNFLASVGALDPSEVESVVARVRYIGIESAPDILVKCDAVFEGVPETLEAKAGCLALIGRTVHPDCIVASTTSTMDAQNLAQFIGCPERFLNAHWLNPAYLMPLVELSPSSQTSPTVLARMRDLLTRIGKVPVVCRSSPGYIVPRIQALAMNEAARIVEEGVASAEDVDTAIRVGFGLRFAILGMLEFIDWGGGDILFHAGSFLSANIDNERFKVPKVIDDNMSNHRRGLRDAQGFYDYREIDINAYRVERLTAFARLLMHRGLMPKRG